MFFCRFDGVALDPEQDVVDVPIVSDACIPPLELHLYNSTGITCMDLQYYPMMLFRRGLASNSTSKALSEDTKGVRTRMVSKTNIRSRRDIASVDVHDEKPLFFF